MRRQAKIALIAIIGALAVGVPLVIMKGADSTDDRGTASPTPPAIPTRSTTNGPSHTALPSSSMAAAPTGPSLKPVPKTVSSSALWHISDYRPKFVLGSGSPSQTTQAGQPSGPSRTSDVAEASGRAETSSASPSTGGPYVSPLSRTDPVPAGLAAQLSYFQGGGDLCFLGLTDLTAVVRYRPDLPYMAAPDTVDVCIYGYASTGDVRFEVRDPSGNLVETYHLSPHELDQSEVLTFRRLHSDPMGIYELKVIQGDRTTSTTIDVRPAPSPQFIGIFDHPTGVPLQGLGAAVVAGDKVRVAVGGFQPNTTVLLHIYSNPDWNDDYTDVVIDYLTSVPVTVDSKGGGLWELQTAATDDRDIYVLHSELVTRRMFPAPDSPEAPSTRWEVEFLLVDAILD